MFRPLELYVGLRYTRAKRRNHFISFISLISMVGLIIGQAVGPPEAIVSPISSNYLLYTSDVSPCGSFHATMLLVSLLVPKSLYSWESEDGCRVFPFGDWPCSPWVKDVWSLLLLSSFQTCCQLFIINVVVTTSSRMLFSQVIIHQCVLQTAPKVIPKYQVNPVTTSPAVTITRCLD